MIRGHESSGGGNRPDRRGPSRDAGDGVVAEGSGVPAGRDVHDSDNRAGDVDDASRVHDDDPAGGDYHPSGVEFYLSHDYVIVSRVDYDDLVASIDYHDGEYLIDAARKLVDHVDDGGREEGVRLQVRRDARRE